MGAVSSTRRIEVGGRYVLPSELGVGRRRHKVKSDVTAFEVFYLKAHAAIISPKYKKQAIHVGDPSHYAVDVQPGSMCYCVALCTDHAYKVSTSQWRPLVVGVKQTTVLVVAVDTNAM